MNHISEFQMRQSLHDATEFARMDHKPNQSNRPTKWLLGVGMFLAITILILRMADLQIVQGNYYRDVADNQRIRTVSIPAARGIIYDRNKTELVRNVPVFRQLHIDPKTGLKLVNITRQQALEAHDSIIIESIDREYLFGADTAHILGYLGEVTEKELREPDLTCQSQLGVGSRLGRSGVEQRYDCLLRGHDGGVLIEVDTTGGLIRELGRTSPQSGENLTLTLDMGLQQSAYQALEGQIGAVVISNPFNGHVYAMASNPSYDPHIFGLTSRIEHPESVDQALTQIFQDATTPLVNRAISAQYPPGSIFKLVTATAGLEEGAITANELYTDTGIVELGSYQFRNWYYRRYGGGEGEMNVVKAIARSTDTFFYEMGGKTGIDGIAKWARLFGFDAVTGIELPGEVDGLIPDDVWKRQTKGERWYLGNTYHVAIGQGDVLVTPLQANAMTNVFADHGTYCPPTIIMEQTNPNCRQLPIDPDNLQTVIEGMVQACATGGTAYPLFNFPIKLACKTGTAEYGPPDENGIRETHGWLTVMGPMVQTSNGWQVDQMDHPITITVLIESGGEGSDVAAPVAKRILTEWFALTPEQLTPTPTPIPATTITPTE